ncbi:hypothetical protein HPB48_021287 [Haemaphysalis longicornis]|uniref:Glycosyltransferase family 92 protein n=1 Tax=Haemaphysalis longicornis TaxID=44386 RepID=A0A9J6FL43_HAELO|nr:hypothetical protein HPB48_021287 [Haemaphysalis longicornis]
MFTTRFSSCSDVRSEAVHLVARVQPDVHRFRIYPSRWDQALLESQLGKDLPIEEPVAGAAVTADLQVYTAFLTDTVETGVHIVGLVRVGKQRRYTIPPLECFIKAGRQMWQTPVKVHKVYQGGLRDVIQTLHLICPIMISPTELPEHLIVAIKVSSNDSAKMQWIRVHVPPPPDVKAKCCSVCVRPMYSDNLKLWELIEFVTHYRMLGANNFYFYYLRIHQPLKLLISRLQSMGMDITLIPMKRAAFLSTVVDHERVAYIHQLVALADCVLRSRVKTEFYLHVDFDELMVPGRGADLTDVINQVEKEQGTKPLGSMIVRSNLFCYEYGLDYAEMRRRESLPLRSRVLHRRPKAIVKKAWYCRRTNLGRESSREARREVSRRTATTPAIGESADRVGHHLLRVQARTPRVRVILQTTTPARQACCEPAGPAATLGWNDSLAVYAETAPGRLYSEEAARQGGSCGQLITPRPLLAEAPA